jgi:uncharacterized ParB-like nuclease family protein
MIYLGHKTKIINKTPMVKIQEIPISQIQRPLPRQNDPQKVVFLMASIAEIGQQ